MFFLTHSIIVRGLSKKQFNVLLDISYRLNDLRNCAVETTYLFKTDDGIHYGKNDYKLISTQVKNKFNMKYSVFQAYLANSAIRNMLIHLMLLWR